MCNQVVCAGLLNAIALSLSWSVTFEGERKWKRESGKVVQVELNSSRLCPFSGHYRATIFFEEQLLMREGKLCTGQLPRH